MTTEHHDLAKLAALLKAATPEPWRVENAHDLWREIRHGYGTTNRMVADCLVRDDGPLIVAFRNAGDDLVAVVQAAMAIADAHPDVEPEEPDTSNYDDMEFYGYDSACRNIGNQLRAALAKFTEEEADD